MAITEEAQKNHDDLFPGHVSTLKVTDPELIEHFDNFAFDEVLRHGDLDTRTRLMVQLASMIASQALSDAALTVGVTPVEAGHVAVNLHVGNDRSRLIDIVTQLLPNIGYPRTLNALRVIDEVTSA